MINSLCTVQMRYSSDCKNAMYSYLDYDSNFQWWLMLGQYLRGIPFNVMFDWIIWIMVPFTIYEFLNVPNAKPEIDETYDNSDL